MRCRPFVRIVLVLLFVLPALGGETTRISVGPDGEQADGLSFPTGISKSGRYTAFSSDATNHVPGDTNDARDVFVHDRKRGTRRCVSLAADGGPGNQDSAGGEMSLNGRWITFYSFASNLVPGDTNDARDVFLRDRKKGTTIRASVSGEGVEGNGGSAWSVISGNGRIVAYSSGARNLVAGDTNEVSDIFVHDRKRRTTERVSVSSEGVQANAGSSWISLTKNGRLVLFRTTASNLVPDDTNGKDDLFLHDRRKGTTTRISVSPDGEEGDGDCVEGKLTPNGRLVVYTSSSTNLLPGNPDRLTHVYVLDRKGGNLRRVSVDNEGNPGNGDCYHPRISPCGRWVAYASSGNDLVPNDTNGFHDLFLHDLRKGTTTRIPTPQSNGDDWRPNLSARAKYVAFYSYSSNLVPGDTNDDRDVFLYRR